MSRGMSRRHRISKQRRDGSRQLFLIDLALPPQLTGREDIRADHRHPDLAGTLRPEAVCRPLVGLPATAMIGGDQDGRTVPIEGIGLHEIPEIRDHPVDIRYLLQVRSYRA